jgi:hypothetical protein
VSLELLENPIVINNEQEAIQFIKAIRKSKRKNRMKRKKPEIPLEFDEDLVKLLDLKRKSLD